MKDLIFFNIYGDKAQIKGFLEKGLEEALIHELSDI